MTSPATTISMNDAIQGLLDAGKWSASSDEDLRLGERLPLDLIEAIIKSYPADKRTIGLLSLSMGAGKWGVEEGALADGTDPAQDRWRGPGKASGKHLMSYRTGGVGLPHLDTGALASFIDFLLQQHTDIGSSSEQETLRRMAAKLRDGYAFAAFDTDPTFRKWMLQGLRQKDAQFWIMEHWLTKYWDPALKAADGDGRLTLVLARVWNSAPAEGQRAAERAKHADDKVQAVLDGYVRTNRSFEKDRWPWMKRPVVLFDMFNGNN